MPTEVIDQTIDWPGIRAAAVQLGIRGSARHAAKDLPADEQTRFVERVMKRASREGWRDSSNSVKSAIVPMGKPLSASVRNGAETVKSAIAEDSEQTKISLSRASRKLARQAESAELCQAGDVLSVIKGAAVLHGWDKQSTAIRISVFAQTVSMDEAMPYADAIDVSDDDSQELPLDDPAFT